MEASHYIGGSDLVENTKNINTNIADFNVTFPYLWLAIWVSWRAS